MNTRLLMYQARGAARRLYTSLLCPQQCLLCGHRSQSSLPLCRECIATKLQGYVNRSSFASPRSSGHRAPFDPPLLCLEKPASQAASFTTAPTSQQSGTATVEQRCRHCGKILISERGCCTNCKTLESGDAQPAGTSRRFGKHDECDRMFTLFPYIGLGQKLLPQWKNQSIRTLSTVFAPLIYSFLMQNPHLMQLPIVPVPPRPKKLREKGWDQIADLAADLAIYPELTILHCLKRQDGIAQKKLSKEERANNLEGKIHLTVAAVPHKTIVLDDVRTTGATLNACAHALKTAGCKTVYGLCLFFD